MIRCLALLLKKSKVGFGPPFLLSDILLINGVIFTVSLEEKISDIITPSLNDMGYDIVRLRILNRPYGDISMKILEILIERIDDAKVSIGDCKKASNQISALLDVEEVIESKYNLEVSSAGVERPLIKLKDFDRFKGYVIALKLHNAVDGTKKYEATLVGVKEDKIILKLEKEILLEIEFENIKDAKLVLTEELFRKIVK